MDFITPATWVLTLLTTKAIEKNGEKIGEALFGEEVRDRLRRITHSISQRLSSKLAQQQLNAEPEKILQSPSTIADITAVIKDSPEVAKDIQDLAVAVNLNLKLVLAMEQILQECNYDPSLQAIVKKISTQLNNLKWELKYPPTPIDNLESPYGVVPRNSMFYINYDDIQTQCRSIIMRPSGFLKIKAPPQRGKTSLLERLVADAQQLNYRTIRINLEDAGNNTLQDLDLFLQWLCRQICRQSNIQIGVRERWDGYSTCIENCTEFIERYILNIDSPPLLLCFDNLELLCRYRENYHDFLNCLRSWSQNMNVPWNSLRIILVHIFPLNGMNIYGSPLEGVGQRVELKELNTIQVQDLVSLHGLNWNDRHIEELMKLVGGHPLLIRLALYEAALNRTFWIHY
jgi:AAA-like domain